MLAYQSQLLLTHSKPGGIQSFYVYCQFFFFIQAKLTCNGELSLVHPSVSKHTQGVGAWGPASFLQHALSAVFWKKKKITAANILKRRHRIFQLRNMDQSADKADFRFAIRSFHLKLPGLS